MKAYAPFPSPLTCVPIVAILALRMFVLDNIKVDFVAEEKQQQRILDADCALLLEPKNE